MKYPEEPKPEEKDPKKENKPGDDNSNKTEDK